MPLLEAPGQTRGGRFGWKNQQASLLSFAADAYLNEQGITTRLLSTDTTTVCKDPNIPDPEDHPDAIGMADIDHFAAFMRGTNAPPVDSFLMATPDAQAGQQIFNSIGCATCHVPSITTAPVGTVINGGTFLRHAVALAGERGFRLVSVDSTVILERPKLKDYRDAIREELATALGLAPDHVSVKFKTAEKLGPVGEGRAAEAHAVATLENRSA